MSSLGEASPAGFPVRVWAIRAGVGLAGLALLVFLVSVLRTWIGAPVAPKHQVAKIAILPDIPPPPPPPPPKEEKKPEPKEQLTKQVDTPKQEKPPEPQQLKMEGPAGDAPSPFAGGDVKSDYIGGDIGGGNGRDKYAYYTDRLAQQIQEELARRNLHGAGGQFLLWLAADGTIKQFKLKHSSGSAETDQLIQTYVAEIGRVKEAPPGDMPMPVGLDITVH